MLWPSPYCFLMLAEEMRGEITQDACMCEAQILFQKKVQSTIQELSRKHILLHERLWRITFLKLWILCERKCFVPLEMLDICLAWVAGCYSRFVLLILLLMSIHDILIYSLSFQDFKYNFQLYFLDSLSTWWTFRQSNPDWGRAAVLRTAVKTCSRLAMNPIIFNLQKSSVTLTKCLKMLYIINIYFAFTMLSGSTSVKYVITGVNV